jgi:adenosylcobyric acid synthase
MQMLGRALHDPDGIESEVRTQRGFGWLDYETTLTPHKHLVNAEGRLALDDAPVRGYEIHMGETRGPALERPALWLDGAGGARPDGALSEDGQLIASYLHGLFDTPAACAALLRWAGLEDAEVLDYDARRQASLDTLADTVAANVDLNALWRVVA